jgi:3-dehydroquinate dehydratase II
MLKVLLLNGPNLGRLGKREPSVYGTATLADLEKALGERAKTLGVKVDAFQSDVEGLLVSKIGASEGVYDGIIFNPGAYTHTSIALRDALQSVRVPCVEVHLSNTAAREEFRNVSFTAPACLGQIMGLGILGYELALLALVDYLASRPKNKSQKR